MEIITGLLMLAILVIAFLVYFLYNSVQLNKEYEQTIIEIKKNLNDTYENLKLVDNNGAFESDDEVGFVFSYLLSQIKELNFKYNREDVEEKEEGRLEGL